MHIPSKTGSTPATRRQQRVPLTREQERSTAERLIAARATLERVGAESGAALLVAQHLLQRLGSRELREPEIARGAVSAPARQELGASLERLLAPARSARGRLLAPVQTRPREALQLLRDAALRHAWLAEMAQCLEAERLPPEADDEGSCVDDSTLLGYVNVETEAGPRLVEVRLSNAVHAGALDEARGARLELERCTHQLVTSNAGLVWLHAGKLSRHGLDIEDLAQEGHSGLLHATESFDPSRGFRFSTYAGWWIRQSMVRALDRQARLVRLPSHVRSAVAGLKRTQRELTAVLGAPPTEAQLADALDIDEARAAELMAAGSTSVTSLDAPVSGADPRTLGETLPDIDRCLPEASCERSELATHIRNSVALLGERERYVIERRYGLDSRGRIDTLAQIGDHLGVSKERVRQIESRALERLRLPLAGSLGSQVPGGASPAARAPRLAAARWDAAL